MNEHYGLSKAQKIYLSKQTTLSNPGQEKSRIKRKAEQSFEIAIPILRSKVVSQEFKDECYPLDKIKQFLKYLAEYDTESLPEDEVNKQFIARTMIETGTFYFQRRYDLNPMINRKITEINQVLEAFDYEARMDYQQKEAMKMYKIRKKLPSPPTITPDKHYHAVCLYCFSYDKEISKTKEKAIESVPHHKDCVYHKERKRAKDDSKKILKLNEQFFKVVMPVSKK